MAQCTMQFHAADGTIFFCVKEDDHGAGHETVGRPRYAEHGVWKPKPKPKRALKVNHKRSKRRGGLMAYFALRGKLFVLEFPDGTEEVTYREPTQDEVEDALDAFMEAMSDGAYNPSAGSTGTKRFEVSWTTFEERQSARDRRGANG